MRHIKTTLLKTTLLCVSGLGLFAASTPAHAGGCGFGVNPALCNTGVTVNPGTGPVFGPTSVNVHQPMGHLRSVNFQRAPNVSVTRVHGMMDSADLSDYPSSFSGGCHPTSTAYCRQDAGVPVNVEFNAPQAPQFGNVNFQPVMPSMPAPIVSMPAPIMTMPAPRTVAIGGGYDPSKFIPRTYGDNTFTPGTVYAPTSFINRNPADAARVLANNGYSTGSYSTGSYGQMNLSAPLMSSQLVSGSLAAPIAAPAMPAATMGLSGTSMLAGGLPAPAMGGMPGGANYLGSVVTGQTTTGSAAPSANAITGVDGSGGYWEKVSGLTMFGDTVATSVVCRRQAPQTTAQVVSPVYGIPQPIPTPVPQYIDVPYKVRGNFMPQGCRPAGRPFIAPPLMPQPIAQPVMPRPAMAPFPAAMPGVLPYGPTFGGGFGAQHMRSGWTY